MLGESFLMTGPPWGCPFAVASWPFLCGVALPAEVLKEHLGVEGGAGALLVHSVLNYLSLFQAVFTHLFLFHCFFTFFFLYLFLFLFFSLKDLFMCCSAHHVLPAPSSYFHFYHFLSSSLFTCFFSLFLISLIGCCLY